MDKDNFNLLLNRKIIDILIGDKEFGALVLNDEQTDISVSMPYINGSNLCDLSSSFGLLQEQPSSRWCYLYNLISHCIEKGKVSVLLSWLTSKQRFEEKLLKSSVVDLNFVYDSLIKSVIGEINKILFFSDHELVCHANQWFVQQTHQNIQIATPKIKNINREYISQLSDRALKDITERNFDSALTKARTLLEEVFSYILEQEQCDTTKLKKGDIKVLYAEVKKLYSMQQSKERDKRINELLSGLDKILSAITEMRNLGSDSHGVGSKRIKIDERHARLFVSSAMTMAEFLLDVHLHAKANINR